MLARSSDLLSRSHDGAQSARGLAHTVLLVHDRRSIAMRGVTVRVGMGVRAGAVGRLARGGALGTDVSMVTVLLLVIFLQRTRSCAIYNVEVGKGKNGAGGTEIGNAS